jgi:cell wall-associated NlpC family hydrolase
MPHRDLGDPELWRASVARSRARREAPRPRLRARSAPRWGSPSRRVLAAMALAVAGAAPVMAATGGGAGSRTTPHVRAVEPSPRLDQGQATRGLEPVARLRADNLVAAETADPEPVTARRAGPAPRRRAKAAATPRPRRIATSREAIVRMQQRLHLEADGVFGPRTKRALKRFQRRHDLTPDGVLGPATYRALGLPPGPVVKPRPVRRRGGGGGDSRLAAMVRAANRIAGKPYKWGGGHGSWTDSGYDCSGAVSYVLHAAGLLGAPRTADRFMGFGVPGRGRRVTIYAKNSHVFMVINGRRFDTTGRESSGSFWQPEMRDTSAFVARHPAGL